jgi:hypothetical protein
MATMEEEDEEAMDVYLIPRKFGSLTSLVAWIADG